MDAAVIGALAGGALVVLTAVPLAWKWQLGVVRAAVTAALLAASVAVVVGAVATATSLGALATALLVWAGSLALAAALVAYRFYRDPERVPPSREGVIVSPADGTVVYVQEAKSGHLPVVAKHGRPYRLDELTKTTLDADEAVVIGIALNFLDVHVNRAPIAGRIALQEHFPGRFGSLRDSAMRFENERATIVIRRDELEVAVVLIASRLVRRIVTFLSVGDDVATGQRIGMIKFGSQVDVVIPSSNGTRVPVQPGQRVVGGETVVAVVQPSVEAAPDTTDLASGGARSH